MSFTKDPLLDREFLKQLDEYRLHEVFAKIVALTWEEDPIAEVSGKIVSGSISVDGSSAVRRTCNLTLTTDMLSNSVDISNIDWCLKTKFYVYIGLKNYVNKEYDDIIWFPQGMFILTSLSQSVNTQGYTISLSGKDKMCLLNGDVSGGLFAAHDFGKMKLLHDNGIEEEVYTSIYDIIKNVVHEYAMEPYENIIINDTESCAVQLVSYTAKNENMFVYQLNSKNGAIQNITFQSGSRAGAFFQAIYDSDDYHDNYEFAADEEVNGERNPFNMSGTLIKACGYGDTAGYQLTELTYAGDLTASVGESITSVLDKIKNQLGEFEYFYNLEGKFVFQRKRIYFNSKWSNAVTNEDGTYYDSLANTSSITYQFNQGRLIESYSNKPELSKIRNDFSIWGAISTLSDTLPIHLRYAIDDKPEKYVSPRGITYLANHVEHKENGVLVDWRELIYQMAKDYSLSQSKIEEYSLAIDGFRTDDYEYGTPLIYFHEVAHDQVNAYDGRAYYIYKDMKMQPLAAIEIPKYINSTYDFFVQSNTMDEALVERLQQWRDLWNTGYDAYYTDMLEFWRTLYCADNYEQTGIFTPVENPVPNGSYYRLTTVGDRKMVYHTSEWREADKPYLYDYATDITEQQASYYYVAYVNPADFATWQSNHYWNPDLINCNKSTEQLSFLSPDRMLFWIDFLDADSGLAPYKVATIGRRTKAVNDTAVKAIFFRDVPGLLFVNPNIDDAVVDTGYVGYTRVNIPESIWNYLTISTQGKSAKEALDAIVYECTYYNDQITLSTVPIYYLEPNTRIQIHNKDINIDGEYLVKSFSIQLQHDGMMSITATKAEENIL